MRDAAFRVYAEATRREVAALRKKLHHAIDAGSRRGRPAPLSTDDALDDPRLADEATGPTRADFFSRELGDSWVEVEPGIYHHAAVPLPEPPLRLTSR